MIAKIEKVLLLKPYIILMLLVVLASANSLKNSFLNIDDNYFIVDNPKINLPLKEIPSVFLTPLGKIHDSTGSQSNYIYYRPVLNLLYAFNYKIWGLNPVGFHLTNIMLHFISSIFLYRTGLFLFDNNKLISLMAAAIFAVHPVNHEALSRVALNEPVYGLFIIISLYFFLKGNRYFSLSAFFLALLSKESAVMLPFALVLLAYHKQGFKGGWITMRPYAILTVIYLILRAMFTDTFGGNEVQQPAFAQILTMAVAASDYIKLLIIPYPLSPFYPARLYTSIYEPRVLLAISILILVSLLIFKLRKDKTMFFLLTFPFIMLAPVIFRVNTFPLGLDLVYIAERFLYVPAMTFSLFISAYAVKLAEEKTEKYVVAGWISIVIVFILIMTSANKMWENDSSIAKKITMESPDSAIAHQYLGNVYFNQRRFDEAIREFKANFAPNYSFYKYIQEYTKRQANSSSGKIYNVQGGEFDLRVFKEYAPGFAVIHFDLGRVYLAQGDIEKASRKFKVATILSPDFVEAHYNLGNVYQKQGKFSDAIKEYETVLKLDSKHADAHQNLEILNMKKKQLQI